MKKYILPKTQSTRQAVILANGEFPTNEIPYSILKNAEFLVCCDGAVNQLERNEIKPNAVVGDCDSLNDGNKIKYADILYPDSDQEINDLTKSVHFCTKKGFKNITILGATGKREDHTIGNISLLAEYLDITNNIEIITNYGIFTPINSNSLFESFETQQVSLFAIENCKITTHNLKYPVEARIFTNWWQGTLNESMANEFQIDTSGKIIVYRAF